MGRLVAREDETWETNAVDSFAKELIEAGVPADIRDLEGRQASSKTMDTNFGSFNSCNP